MAKKIQMMSHDKEWQMVDGVETLVPVEQFDIDPITDSSCVKIEGFRTLEETLNEKNMFTPEIVETKIMDKVGGEYHQNVVDGAYEEAILYGNTQVNLCEEDTSNTLTIPTTFTSFNNGELQINNKENQVVAPLIKGVTMVNLAQTNSASITSGNATVIRNVKGNTVYTLSFTFTTKNTNSGVTIQCYDGNGTFIENTMHKTGLGDVVKFTFTTHANATKVHICNNTAYGGETIQLDEIMLIEGDQTALDIPFFRGMKSVELVRPLTNLFDNNTPTNHSWTGVTNVDGTVTATSQTSGTWTYARFNITFKPNTSYVVMWDSLTYTQTGNANQTIAICYGNDIIANIDNNFTNKRSIIFNTGDRNPSDINLRIHATTKNTETGTTTVTGLRVFEYDDYLRSVDLQSIGWFSGTKNVAVEPIKTCSKNLYPYGDINFTPTSTGWFDAKGNSQMTGDIASKSHSRFLLKKGTYYFSIESNTNAFCQLTDDKENMGVNANSSFTLQEDKYVTLRVKVTTANTSTTVTNIQIERGETATAYVAHDSRYYEPNGQNTIVLRSLPDGVCDTFNLQTGEYIQRIGEAVLDGTKALVLDAILTNTIRFRQRDNVTGLGNQFCLCDKMVSEANYVSDYEHIYVNKTDVWCFINKKSLSSEDVDGIRQYLKSNPLTVQYELATPITTIIPRTVEKNSNGTVSTVDFKTYTNKENFRLPNNPTFLTINSMTSIKPIVEPITYFDFKTRLKANTDYSVIIDKDSANKTINLGGTSKTYTDKMLVRTPSINLEQNLRISGSGSIQNIMVIEGDVLSKELPYFNGMCNVKMPIIRNCGKNLFDTQFELGTMSSSTGVLTSVTTAIRAIDYIKVNGGKQYVFYCDNLAYKFAYVCYDANKKFLRTIGASSSGTVIGLGSNVQYVKMRTPDGHGMNDINVKLSLYEYNENTPTTYEPYRGNDVCIAQGEIGLSQDMFEQGGISYPALSDNMVVKTYEQCKGNSSTRLRNKTIFKINGGKTYKLTLNDSSKRFQWYLWGQDGKNLGVTGGWSNTSNTSTVTVPQEAAYMSLMFKKTNESTITVDELNLELFQLLELDSTVQLRSLPNGVKDELNLLTGEYIQRVGEVVFDGSEDEGWHMEDVNVVNHLCFDTVYAGVLETNPLYTNFRISDKFDSISHEEYLSDSVEGIRYFSIPAISISRSKLNEPNVTGFKQYLQQNPITVQYQLAEPIISYPRIVSNTQEREVGVKLPNGVCDTYNPSTGITVKRVGKAILDGSEDWNVDSNNFTNVYRFTLKIEDMVYKNWAETTTSKSFAKAEGFITLDLSTQAHNLDIEHLTAWDVGRIILNISKNKVAEKTLSALKTYLASNPITVWYELKNPIVTTDIVLPNGVHDEYNPLTGLYTKRVMCIEFDGSNDEKWSPKIGTGNDTHCYASISIDGTFLPQMKHMANDDEVYIMSDKFETVSKNNYSYDREQFYVWSVRTVYLNILQSRLSTLDMVGFRQYLSQNPIKLWYELQTPITYQLTPYFGLPMPYAYKDGYLIMDSAYNGQTLPPEIKYKLLANRTGQITQNNIKLQNHTSKLSNLEAMLVEATLQSIYEREMMAFNLEMVNINLINLEE